MWLQISMHTHGKHENSTQKGFWLPHMGIKLGTYLFRDPGATCLIVVLAYVGKLRKATTVQCLYNGRLPCVLCLLFVFLLMCLTSFNSFLVFLRKNEEKCFWAQRHLNRWEAVIWPEVNIYIKTQSVCTGTWLINCIEECKQAFLISMEIKNGLLTIIHRPHSDMNICNLCTPWA